MSTPDNAIQDILRTAVQREIDAHTLYSTTAEKTQAPHAKEILQELAAQELGHRKRLESLLAGNAFRVVTRSQQKQVQDLKITDYLVEVPLTPDSDFQDILIVAGKREKGSHDLYAALSKVSEDADTAKLFDFLSAEELAHKNRIESLYEEIVYKDN